MSELLLRDPRAGERNGSLGAIDCASDSTLANCGLMRRRRQPSLHARAVWEAISTAENVHVLDYFFCMKPGPLEEFLRFVEKTRADTGQLLMVVFDKVTDPGQKRFAGLVHLYDAEGHKFLELGPVLILPEFQVRGACLVTSCS